MIKEFIYKDYAFIIDVELNTQVERTPNGRRYSTIIISNTSGPKRYNKVKKVENQYLRKEILEFEEDMKDFVDKNDDYLSDEEKVLNILGFK